MRTARSAAGLVPVILALMLSVGGTTDTATEEPTYGVEIRFVAEGDSGLFIFTAIVSENETGRVLSAPKVRGTIGSPVTTHTTVEESGVVIDAEALMTESESSYEVIITKDDKMVAVHKGTLSG